MVLHLGMDYILPQKDIFFILKYDCLQKKVNQVAIDQLKKNAQVVYIGDPKKDKFKSIIYGSLMGTDYLFFSPISTSTLMKRIKEKAKFLS